MPQTVIILHGYSDDWKSFTSLAKFLKGAGFKVVPIFLGDYLTLEDQITIPDLAKAFETALTDAKIDVKEGNISLIVHSAGALVARDWLTRFFLEEEKPCPLSHFLMLAPANFGSPLAHVGKTMFGRIIKGWRSGFEVGTQVLNALELASPYSWQLARRDVFPQKSFYRPDVCKTAVLVGSKPYQAGLRAIVDKPGGDGTVYVCTSNLNVTGMTIRFGRKQEKPEVQPWENPKQRVAFGVFPDRDHRSITQPENKPEDLGEYIVDFLNLESTAAYTTFRQHCDELTEATLPKKPDQDIHHSYQNVVAHVSDDLSFGVDDYFLEFYEKPTTRKDEFAIDDLMVRVHSQILEDVHPYTNDQSYRSLLFDLTDLNAVLEGGRHLMFSLSAAPLSNLISFSAGAANGISELPVDLQNSRFWRPNETLLLELIIERQQKPKIFQLHKY